MNSPFLSQPLRSEAQARTEKLCALLEARNAAHARHVAAIEQCDRYAGDNSLLRMLARDAAREKALIARMAADDAYNAALKEFVKSGDVIEFPVPDLEAAGAGGIK